MSRTTLLRSLVTVTLAAICVVACVKRNGTDTGYAGVRPTGSPAGAVAPADPPGGLLPEQVPQFVHFGFDDNGISGRAGSGTNGGVTWVTRLFQGKQNPAGQGNARTYDGAAAQCSFYVSTKYIDANGAEPNAHVKHSWRAAVDAGHEIGIHTHNHPHGAPFTPAQWSEEIVTCRNWLTKPFDAERAEAGEIGIGVSAADITGFRAPFLEYGPRLFPALRQQGLAYDCSVEEGFEGSRDGTNLRWPYRIEPKPGETATPELWEIPAYVVVVPPDDECERYGVKPGLRDKLKGVKGYFEPANGKITGFDWNLWIEFGMTPAEVLATLKYTLDRRLAGNRAPFTFGTHSDIYSEQYPAEVPRANAEERRQILSAILDYALSKPEVRVVSAAQILAWVQEPASL